MTILLGGIADNFTGATDLANNLVRAGMRMVQTIVVPPGRWPPKSMQSWLRSSRAPIAPAEAVARSLESLRGLLAQGRVRSVSSTAPSAPRSRATCLPARCCSTRVACRTIRSRR